MKTRRAFLANLFEVLEQKGVPYCVLRNYENVYEDISSDVDVAVGPEDLDAFKECLDAAAAASDCAFIHQARFTNYSYVYGHPPGQFVRVDVETEVRWRIFPVLSASSVIGLRRKLDGFYIPHPKHESVILFVASVWRGYLKERYQRRLAALNGEVEDVEEWSRTFRACFGRAGPMLEVAQRGIRTVSPDRTLWSSAKRYIALNAFSSRGNVRALFGYIIQDLQRFWQRLKNPPGISVLYICVGDAPDETADVFKRVEFLFPMQKLGTHCLRVAPGRSEAARLDFKARLHRLYTLFKGGIFMRYYQVANDSEIPKVAGTISRFLYPSRAFFCAQTSQGFWMGHVRTGFMTGCATDAAVSTRHDELIRFITSILMRNRVSVAPAASRSLEEGIMEPKQTGGWARFGALLGRMLSFPRLAWIGLGLMLIGTISFLAISQLNHQARGIVNDTLPGLSCAGAANASLAQSFNRTLMLLLCEVPEQRDQLEREIDGFSQKTSGYLDAYRGQIFSAEDQALFDSLLKRREEYIGVRERTVGLMQKDRNQALLLYRRELLPAYQRYKEAGDKLFEYNTHQGVDRGQSVLALCTGTPFIFWGVGTALFLSGVIVGIFRQGGQVWVPVSPGPVPNPMRKGG